MLQNIGCWPVFGFLLAASASGVIQNAQTRIRGGSILLIWEDIDVFGLPSLVL